MTESDRLAHVSADLSGIGSGALRDAELLNGLLIAAAGAAGLNPCGTPLVRTASTGGISAVLVLDTCHVSIHSLPRRGLALVDVFAPDAAGANKALDVFVRRLVTTAGHQETHGEATQRAGRVDRARLGHQPADDQGSNRQRGG